MRDLSKMTTGEAEAYRLGYQDGQASKPRPIKIGPYIECKSGNPDVRCERCDCWKIFREYCM
jgi:hypothetical protein